MMSPWFSRSNSSFPCAQQANKEVIYVCKRKSSPRITWSMKRWQVCRVPQTEEHEIRFE